MDPMVAQCFLVALMVALCFPVALMVALCYPVALMVAQCYPVALMVAQCYPVGQMDDPRLQVRVRCFDPSTSQAMGNHAVEALFLARLDLRRRRTPIPVQRYRVCLLRMPQSQSPIPSRANPRRRCWRSTMPPRPHLPTRMPRAMT